MKELNLARLLCPMPVIKTQNALKGMKKGNMKQLKDLNSFNISLADGLNDNVELCSIRHIGMEDMKMGVLFGASEGHDVWGGASRGRGETDLIVVNSARVVYW